MEELPKIPQDNRFKAYCNSLRCPLCGAQLDGNIHPKGASLYCVNNNSEYTIKLNPNFDKPINETLMHTFNDYEYLVTITRAFDSWRSIILRVSTDIHPELRYRYWEEIFRFDGRLTFFKKKLTKEEFIRKLKLYNVFS